MINIFIYVNYFNCEYYYNMNDACMYMMKTVICTFTYIVVVGHYITYRRDTRKRLSLSLSLITAKLFSFSHHTRETTQKRQKYEVIE